MSAAFDHLEDAAESSSTSIHATKTRSQQLIVQLVNARRPLTQEESDDLYRALHADYCRKWRAARKAADERRRDIALSPSETFACAESGNMSNAHPSRKEG